MSSQQIEIILNSLRVDFAREFKFHPLRRWRFDFAIPDLRIAIEYEGIFSAKSRHTSVKGFSNDCEKYNEAAALGWKVYRFSNMHLKNGYAYDFIKNITTME